MKLDHDFLDRLEDYGPIARTLSMCLRPTFVSQHADTTLVWGDWSAIEARKLPWLANNRGSNAVLDVFRRVDKDPDAPDVYMIEAGNIHGVDAVEINARIHEGDKEAKGWRQEGKVAVLSLGFGGSVGALMAMAVGYGLHYDEKSAQRIVDIWRENNPWAKRFWAELKEAFFAAYENPGNAYPAGRVTYIYDPDYHGGTVFCVLPCGRLLSYPNLRYREVERTDRVTGDTYTVKTLTYRKGYKWGAIWHGILCLAGDTKVATGRGWVRLDSVRADDLLWDGEAWVAHSGLLNKGKSHTINVDGVRLTADHEILTKEGWVRASQCEGLDRAEVRLPDGYKTCVWRAPERQKEISRVRMVIRMRLWLADIAACVRSGARQCNVCGRLRASTYIRKQVYARNVKAPGLRRMGQHESPLYTKKSSCMEKLRRAWDTGVCLVDGFFRSVLGGHGRLVQTGAVTGTEGQRQGLLERELPLGDVAGAKREQTRQPSCGHTQSGTDNRYVRKYHEEPVGEETVYDIVNAGPRTRFVVLSDAGPMIVHNCENPTQASAASVLRAKLRQIDADCERDFAAGYEPLLTVRGHTHDEIIGECHVDDVKLARSYLKTVMDAPLEWTDGLPLVSEITDNWWYTKSLD